MSILRNALLCSALVLLPTTTVMAQDALVVSSWGGDWRDMIENTIARKFTEVTGVEVQFITGGTIDRLNQAQLAAGNPESDITFTTSHVGWLYKTGDLYEPLDMARIPNAANLFPEGVISDSHLGVWSYVYYLVYRKDLLPEGTTFDSWADLWDPQYANMIGMADFDPSPIIAVSAILEGGDASNWEVGQQRLLDLKPNVRAYYSSDAASEQFMSTGETPIQVMLSMNALYQMESGMPLQPVIPAEGGVMGIDTIGIMRGTDKLDLAYQFINIALDPEVQAEIVRLKNGGPMVTGVDVEPEIAALPGVFTTTQQWEENAIIIDHRLRSEKLSEWRTWFSENMMAQ